MTDDFGFNPRSRGLHRLAGRTVLQLVPALAGSDDGLATIEVAAALAEAGARPLVASPIDALVPELQAKGGAWIDFSWRSRVPLASLVLRRSLRRLIGQEQVDLVHARSAGAGRIACGAARAAGVPFVTSLPQLSAGLGPLRQHRLAVLAEGDAVLVGSKSVADAATSLYPRAAGKVKLVRPGVDLGPFVAAAIPAPRVQAVRQLFGAAPDERILLLAAEPSVWKGHRVLIEAVRILRERGIDDLKLVFIGDERASAGFPAAFAREIDGVAAAAGLAGRIAQVAECADRPAALLAATAVVVPSIEAGGFTRIAVEAQAIGTPVVVSDTGALPETVLAPPDVEAAKRTGWRVTPNDAAGLADALGEVLALGASGRDALGRRARRQVEERFAMARMTRETLEAYAALLEGDAGPD